MAHQSITNPKLSFLVIVSDLLLFTHLHSFIGGELHICSLPIFLLFILTLPLHPILFLLPFPELSLSFFAFIEGYDIR